MAFQQSILAPSRPTPVVSETQQQPTETLPSQPAHGRDSHEWLLFPTVRRPSSSFIQTASTTYTPQTAGLSRLSEFGSFGVACPEDENQHTFDDDEELDSLDEGLQAFDEHPGQENSYVDHHGSILPVHDGLGTFQGSSTAVQDHLWRFEQTNPQRKSFGHTRRRSSVQRKLDALEYDDGTRMEKERTDRIERWRMEHSRILLEEVEKESRRRLSNQLDLPSSATIDNAKETTASTRRASSSTPFVAPSSSHSPAACNTSDGENAFYRALRSLVQDIIGLDERMLSVIFGEALPTEEIDNRGKTSTDKEVANQSLVFQSPRISIDILNRLSHELASALRQFSYAPAAVGSPVNPTTLDYAGIPITGAHVHRASVILPGSSAEPGEVNLAAEPSSTPLFRPTLPERSASAVSDFGHAALWGIEEEPADLDSATRDREYWEQTPTITTIFRLLRQHFTARRRPLLTASTFTSRKPSNVATTATADSLRRTSVIKQHHPLVSRQHVRRSAAQSILGQHHRHYSSHSIPNPSSPLFRRGDSSCASYSSRKSKRGSGSSKNYWDLGGSVASGSVGGIGIWGEV